MRPTYDGEQTALVELEASVAGRLVKARSAKIGWLRYYFSRSIVIKRCFKCHESGHVRAECTDADRRESCPKCGKPGHKTKRY